MDKLVTLSSDCSYLNFGGMNKLAHFLLKNCFQRYASLLEQAGMPTRLWIKKLECLSKTSFFKSNLIF
jgi:hypothetical protein